MTSYEFQVICKNELIKEIKEKYNEDYNRALSHDEAVAVGVEWARRLFGRVVEMRR